MQFIKHGSPKAWLAVLMSAVTVYVLFYPLFAHNNTTPPPWNGAYGYQPQTEVQKVSVACFPVRLPSLVWYDWCVW